MRDRGERQRELWGFFSGTDVDQTTYFPLTCFDIAPINAWGIQKRRTIQSMLNISLKIDGWTYHMLLSPLQHNMTNIANDFHSSTNLSPWPNLLDSALSPKPTKQRISVWLDFDKHWWMSWSLGRYSCVTMRNVENLHYITILLAQRMNSQLPIKSSMPTATCNEFQVVDEDWIEWVFI